MCRGWIGLCRALLCSVLLCATAMAKSEKPNIVWLVSEDNSVHYMKLFNPHGAPTPNIEKLASHGLAFDHAFSNGAVCSVARTTLATMCYGPRIFTQFHRRSVMVPLPDGVKMFPEYLRNAGYYTANNSKTDYNATPGKGVWNESSKKASWRKRADGQPFFYMQSFGVCHESSLHFKAQTLNSVKTTTDPDKIVVHPYHPDTPTFRYTYARYHDKMMDMDRQIGNVVEQLATDGLLEDTFIFYFGDHGGVLPRGKGYAYETGLHVPLVVRIPENWKHLVDAKPGSRVPGFVSFIDFGPTVLNLAGTEIPKGIDGKAFLGKGVSMKEVNQRDEAFGYADRFDEKWDLVRTLRKGNYSYMRNYQPFNFDGLMNNYRYKMIAYREWRDLYEAGRLNEVQSQFFRPRTPDALYDIDADPYETRNLAGDPAYARILAEMRGRLQEIVKGQPDLSLIPESDLNPNAVENPVVYGQKHKQAIGRLVDVADLALNPFDEAQPEIEKALDSAQPWERYWGLIVCSSFGKEAKGMTGKATSIARDDKNLLVRVRAAEFLGVIGAEDPRPVIMKAMAKTKNGVEAGLMLNSVTLLQDGKPGYPFEVSLDHFDPAARKNDSVRRRMEYLDRKPKPPKKKKG